MSDHPAPSQTSRRGHLRVVAAALALLFAIMLVLYTLPAQQRLAWLREGGPVENAAILFYVLAIALFPLVYGLKGTLQRWYFPLIVLAMALREADLDKRAFSLGLLKSRQYTQWDNPAETLTAIAVAVILLIALALFVKNHALEIARGVLAFQDWALAFMAAAFLLVTSKAMDGIGGRLTQWQGSDAQPLIDAAFVYEEVGETGIAVMFCLLLFLQYMARKRHGDTVWRP